MDDKNLHDDSSPYEILGIPEGASASDIRRAGEAIRSTFRLGEIAVYSLLENEAERTDFLAQVDRAVTMLLEEAGRRTLGEESGWTEKGGQSESGGSEAMATTVEEPRRASVNVDINTIEYFDGNALARIREGLGLSIGNIADELKISRTQVTALEEMNSRRLPARVYIKGFLRNYARVLRLDAERVMREYMERLPVA